jgi:hypothetical protein
MISTLKKDDKSANNSHNKGGGSGIILADNRPVQVKVNNTGLPNNLKSGIENLSGHSMDDVKVHYNSPKPSQLHAHAYAQGSDIHLASGQEKHLPHEAWHVVQQKQGRVKPTMNIAGKSVNDDHSLESEADEMGAKSVQLKTSSFSDSSKTPKETTSVNATTKQLTKTKTVAGTLGGTVALGAAGIYGGAALGSVVPVIGTIAGGAVGGLVGAGIGALLSYFLSKPKLYKNNQADHYNDELAQYQAYREQHAHADSAYDQGTIIRYSGQNSAAFNALLHMGKVLYIYDESSQLAIGSNAGPIKHAIVAQDQKVKAAGMAVVNYSEAQVNKGEYDSTAAKIVHWQGVLDTVQDAAQLIIQRFAEEHLSLQEMAERLGGDERETIQTYRTCLDQLEHWGPELEHLGELEHEDIVASKNNNVRLDNESGHYHPGPKTKDEAFEGWNDAGYRNLTWNSH